MTGNFSENAMSEVANLLNLSEDLKGECGQKEKKEQQSTDRTKEQRAGDQERAAEMTGRDTVPSGVREKAAEEAAKTREKCTPKKPEATPSFEEMKQSIAEKRRKIKQLQSEGHPASILIKQVRDRG